MAKVQPHVFERGDRIYIVAPVSPFEPGENEIEEFAFSQELKKQAPNPNFLWLRGNYVEADNPNRNGHMWTAGELQMKSLTPMYCPVTVMHDPATAVGLIAEASLKTPEQDGVPRARIETALAIWAHRFPDIAEEIGHNYEAGMLMQSMECQAPYYECGECGQVFQKLPDGAEQANWCGHLAETPNASRILRGVTFTGTGLIFGTRGTEGAYSEANLELAVQEEIAEAHRESHERTGKSKKTRTNRSKTHMEISNEEYAALKARPTPEELAAEKKRADDAEQAKTDAEKEAEAAEVAQKKAEKDQKEAEDKLEKAEEAERARELASDRLSKLGADFKKALPESVSKRLETQAAEYNDEDYEARLKELEDLTEVQRDAKPEENEEGAEESGGTPDLTREEVASAPIGSGRSGGDGKEPSNAARASVIGGLMRPKAKETK